MDYLYDKVELYDTVKNIMQGHGSTDHIPAIQSGLADIEHHMLHFLENHDEQRIASQAFAGSAEKGKPAMVVSACISTSPTMLYFGQNVGEPGDGNPGFGEETRTTILDYWGVPAHQRWMNNGMFDGGQLSPEEKELSFFYKTLLSFASKSDALNGNYKEIHTLNRDLAKDYTDKIFSFVRWKNDDKLIVISNFDDKLPHSFQLSLGKELVKTWNLKDGTFPLSDKLTNTSGFNLVVENENATIEITISPLESLVLSL
jgi:hypothetical protein